MEHDNRPFFSCVLSYLSINTSEAGGDLALKQTSLLFLCKCHLVSIRTTWFAPWVIPENIHTIPWAASRNSKGKGDFLDWNSEGVESRGGKILMSPLPVVGYGYFLPNKSSEVCIKTRSTPASLLFRGQVTMSTTVKWSFIDQREVRLQNTKE